MTVTLQSRAVGYLDSRLGSAGKLKRFRRILNNPIFLGYLLITPAVCFIFFVILFPTLRGIWSSFTNENLVKPGQTAFIGFENYLRMFQDPVVQISLWNSLIYVAGTVGLGFIFGFILALLVNEKIKGKAFFRSILIVPWIVPSVVAALVMEWVFNPDYGPLNSTLRSLGLISWSHSIMWLGPNLAMVSVILTSVWRDIPFHMLMLLAGLQAIPISLYEASIVDGATKIQRFRYVTLPNLKFVIAVDTTLEAIWAFKRIDIIYMMTRGGPVYHTEVFPLHIYKMAFLATDFGYAGSLAVLMLIILLAFTYLYWKVLKV